MMALADWDNIDGLKTAEIEGLNANNNNDSDLKVTDLYVDLQLIEGSRYISTSPINKDTKISNAKRQSIWHFLNLNNLDSGSLVILGSPGSGKTTLLKSVMITLINPKFRQQHALQKQWFPVLLFLRQQRERIISKPTITLADLLQQQIVLNPTFPADWFATQLKKRRALILLDGLDEIADEADRQKIIEWISKQILSQAKHRFVITSRQGGYNNNPLKVGGVTVIAVQSLTQEQQTNLIYKWFEQTEFKRNNNPETAKLRAQIKCNQVLNIIKSDHVRRTMAKNPLLLRLMLAVYDLQDSIPNSRLTLYKTITKVMLKGRITKKEVNLPFDIDQIEVILRKLALGMLYREKWNGERGEVNYKIVEELIKNDVETIADTLTTRSFLQTIVLHTGILVKPNEESYAFAHLTFLEYLAALELKEKCPFEAVIPYLDSPNWFEVLRFYGALGGATKLIEACITEPIKEQRLLLALYLQQESIQIHPTTRRKLDVWLDKITDNDAKGESLNLLSRVYWKRKQNNMEQIDDNRWIDLQPCSNLEMLSFYNTCNRMPYYWDPERHSYPEGKGKDTCFGISQNDVRDLLNWLNENDDIDIIEKSDVDANTLKYKYRLPTSTEIQIYKKSGWISENNRESYFEEDTVKDLYWEDIFLILGEWLFYCELLIPLDPDTIISQYSRDRFIQLTKSLPILGKHCAIIGEVVTTITSNNKDKIHDVDLVSALENHLQQFNQNLRDNTPQKNNTPLELEITKLIQDDLLTISKTITTHKNDITNKKKRTRYEMKMNYGRIIFLLRRILTNYGTLRILHEISNRKLPLPNMIPEYFMTLSSDIYFQIENIKDLKVILEYAENLKTLCSSPNTLSSVELLKVVYLGFAMRWKINNESQIKHVRKVSLIRTLDELIARALVGVARHERWIRPFEAVYLVRERIHIS